MPFLIPRSHTLSRKGHFPPFSVSFVWFDNFDPFKSNLTLPPILWPNTLLSPGLDPRKSGPRWISTSSVYQKLKKLSDLTWYILYLYVCRPKMQTKMILDPRESGPRWVSTAKQGEGSQLQWTKNIRRYSLSNICPAQRNGNVSQSTTCTNWETSIYTWIS